MGSPGMSFGSMPGNNAPPPVFGSTNPTGMIPGGYKDNNSFGFPAYSMFGASSNGIVTPEANLGIFPTNLPTNSAGGTGGGTGAGGSGGMQGMDSSFGSNGGSLTQLQNDYGKGIGQMLYNILNGGLFNQNVADSYLNAMQPAYNQGIASQEQAFGAEGARFGSAAALGIGNFSSQFDLNEQQTMATMYMQAQQEQLSLLENILPTVNKEQDNSDSSGWIGDLLGSLEIAGGAIAAPFTGGMSLGLVGAGASTIANANSSTPTNSPTMPNIGMPNMTGLPNTSGNGQQNQDWWNMYPASYWQSVSAGSDLGGTNNQDTPLMDMGIFGGDMQG